MKNTISVICLAVCLLGPELAHAKTVEFESKSYKEAEKASSFLRFDMSSTKFGLITTSFQGFVKKFTASGSLDGEKIAPGASVEFAVLDIDTDVSGRNEKLWNHCLDQVHHSKIKLTLIGAIPLSGEATEVPGVIQLRGYEKPVAIKAQVVQRDTRFEIVLSSSLSIKSLEIPDPSIAIASVKDQINVHAKIIVEGTSAP